MELRKALIVTKESQRVKKLLPVLKELGFDKEYAMDYEGACEYVGKQIFDLIIWGDLERFETIPLITRQLIHNPNAVMIASSGDKDEHKYQIEQGCKKDCDPDAVIALLKELYAPVAA